MVKSFVELHWRMLSCSCSSSRQNSDGFLRTTRKCLLLLVRMGSTIGINQEQATTTSLLPGTRFSQKEGKGAQNQAQAEAKYRNIGKPMGSKMHITFFINFDWIGALDMNSLRPAMKENSLPGIIHFSIRVF